MKMSLRIVLAAAFAALLAACATAPTSQPLATASELEAHVRWLADDAREGRRAGTDGARAAAEYIAREMAAAGLQPAGDDGSWYQEFEVRMAPEAGAVLLEVDGQALAGVGTVAASASKEAEGALVSANYGMVLESHGMNEFADADVEGCVVLVRRYSEFGPQPPPEMAALGNLRNKIRAAADAGAVAIILGTHPDDLERGGDATIEFAAVPGTMPIPVVTVPAATFAQLEQRCRDGADGNGGRARVAAEVVRPTAVARNVLGMLPGSGPDLLVVGAHFDHLGWGGEGSLAPGVHAIHNGADDNASGTAVLLELAEEWGTTTVGMPGRPVGVLFAAWSAEEMGLLGSAHWVEQPTVDIGRVRANINLDMVGRVGEGRITVGSAYTADAFKPALDRVQQDLAQAGFGMQLQVIEGELPGGGGSDHMSFHKVGIPALFFFSGLHSDYHKPTDDADKLDYAGMAEVAYAVSDLLVYLQVAAEEGGAGLAYRKPAAAAGGEQREMRAARVWFGSIPDYGAEPEGGGMQLAGTSPGGPAEKAGLRSGDVIKRIGETAIGDIYDFMDALADFDHGDTVNVVFLRDGAEQEVALTFFPRPAGD